MTLAARLGQAAVVLVLAAGMLWGAARLARRRENPLDRYRRVNEP